MLKTDSNKLIKPRTTALVNNAYATGLVSIYFFCKINPRGIIIEATNKKIYPILKPLNEISFFIVKNTANKHTSNAIAFILLKLFSFNITLPRTIIQRGISKKISVPVLIGTVLKPVLNLRNTAKQAVKQF